MLEGIYLGSDNLIAESEDFLLAKKIITSSFRNILESKTGLKVITYLPNDNKAMVKIPSYRERHNIPVEYDSYRDSGIQYEN